MLIFPLKLGKNQQVYWLTLANILVDKKYTLYYFIIFFNNFIHPEIGGKKTIQVPFSHNAEQIA